MEGWSVEVKQRTGGSSAGTCDVYYYSPAGKRFRSKAEIAREFGVEVKRPQRASLSKSTKHSRKVSREEALRRARERFRSVQLPLSLNSGVRVTQFGTIKPEYCDETVLALVGYKAEFTDSAGVKFTSFTVDYDAHVEYVVEACREKKGEKACACRVGSGKTADQAWKSVAQKQINALQRVHKSPKIPNTATSEHSRDPNEQNADHILVLAEPLKSPWGSERYGFTETRVMQALEGMHNVEHTRYKLVEERSTWEEEERRRMLEGILFGKAPEMNQIGKRTFAKTKEERDLLSVQKLMETVLRNIELQEQRAVARRQREIQKQIEKEKRKALKEEERRLAKDKAEKEREALRMAEMTAPDETLPGFDIQPPRPERVSNNEAVQADAAVLLEAWFLCSRFLNLLELNSSDVPSIQKLESSILNGTPEAVFVIISLVGRLVEDLFDKSSRAISELDDDCKVADFRPPGRSARSCSVPMTLDTWQEVTRRLLATFASGAALRAQKGKKGLPYPLSSGCLDEFTVMQYLTSGPPCKPGMGVFCLPDGCAPHAWVAMLAQEDASALAEAYGGEPYELFMRIHRCILQQITDLKTDQNKQNLEVLCFEGQSAAAALKYGRGLDLRTVAARVDAGVYARMTNPNACFIEDIKQLCMLHAAAMQKSSSYFATRNGGLEVAEVAAFVVSKLEQEMDVLENLGADSYLASRMSEEKDAEEHRWKNQFFPAWDNICIVCWDSEDQERMADVEGTGLRVHTYCNHKQILQNGLQVWTSPFSQIVCQEGESFTQFADKSDGQVLWDLACSLDTQHWQNWTIHGRMLLLNVVCQLFESSPLIHDNLMEQYKEIQKMQKELHELRQRKKYEVKQQKLDVKSVKDGSAASISGAQTARQENGVRLSSSRVQSLRSARDAEDEIVELTKEISKLEREILTKQDDQPIRLRSLGTDRHYNRYYYMPPEASGPVEESVGAVIVERSLVESIDGSLICPSTVEDEDNWNLGLYRGSYALDRLMNWMNTKGERERSLLTELKRRHLELVSQEDIIKHFKLNEESNTSYKPSSSKVIIDDEKMEKVDEMNRLKTALLDFESGLQETAREPIRGSHSEMERWRERVTKANRPADLLAAVIVLENAISTTYLRPHWRPWSYPAPQVSSSSGCSAVWLRLEALKTSIKMKVHLHVAMKDVASIFKNTKVNGSTGVKRSATEHSGSETSADMKAVTSKHHRQQAIGVEGDEAFARKLQAELNSRGRSYHRARAKDSKRGASMGKNGRSRRPYGVGGRRTSGRPNYYEPSDTSTLSSSTLSDGSESILEYNSD